jgi:1-deoxy-D-xylulose-5-phosphate reductoisomerase
MKKLAVLGSTGSIGQSTLSVVESFPERFQIVTLAAGRNLDLLREQVVRHRPQVVCVADQDDARVLSQEFPGVECLSGRSGLVEAACHPDADMLVAALVGSAGLESTLAAVEAGKDVALANKETLVVAGDLVMAAAADNAVNILPVDSEHNAIHQALRVGPPEAVDRLILTASGGPLRTWETHRIREASPQDALAHPTWSMGPKITVDSATLMNKGLEIIEAHHLFRVDEKSILVVVHPQSLVHSLVEYVDGTLIAQLSVNDMRFPIMYALAWPDRLETPLERLSLAEVGNLSFEEPDEVRFPALRLARAALRAGGEMPATLNASNEVAVESFLAGEIKLGTVSDTVAAVLDQRDAANKPLDSLEQAQAVDDEARRLARSYINGIVSS